MDKKRTLYAEILLKYALITDFNLRSCDIHFEVNSYGKPFLAAYSSLHFNLSHSGNYILCAVSTTPVGIDIEEIKDIDLEIAEKFFHPKEYVKITHSPIDQQTRLFYSYWVLKECYIKYIGKGLSLPLNKFFFEINQESIQIHSTLSNDDLWFKFLTIDTNYQAAICCNFPKISANTTLIPEQLTSAFYT